MDVRLIRSLLFVPGDSQRKLAKAAQVPADALILDWEDAVPDSRKELARSETERAMQDLAHCGAAVLIRINHKSADLASGDVEAVRRCAPLGVVLPKCESAEEIESLVQELPPRVLLFPLLESPLGILEAPGIAASSDRVAGLVFGAEDYSAEARIRRTEEEIELLLARSVVVNAARAMRREAFDSPLMRYDDLEAVRSAADRGRRFGFTGQAAIHPRQVPVINEAFAPSGAEIAAAREVVARYEQHGGGVYGVQGVLEDRPAVREALNVLGRAR